MGCGLPIISSDLPFNDDILDETNSLRVHPSDVDAIAQAIRKIKEDTGLRNRLVQGAKAKAQTLRLDERTKRILQIIQEQK